MNLNVIYALCEIRNPNAFLQKDGRVEAFLTREEAQNQIEKRGLEKTHIRVPIYQPAPNIRCRERDRL